MTVDTENLEHEWIVWTETSKNSMLKVIKELIEKNIEVEWVSALKELIKNKEYKKLQIVLGLKWKNADGKLWKLTLEKLYEYIQRQDIKWEFLDVLDSSGTDLKAIKWTETSKNSTLPEIKEFLESKLPNIHIQELYDLILKKDYKWFQRKLGMVWKDCDWMLWKKALKALYEQNFPEDTKETEETDNSGVETSETNTGDVVETENIEQEKEELVKKDIPTKEDEQGTETPIVDPVKGKSKKKGIWSRLFSYDSTPVWEKQLEYDMEWNVVWEWYYDKKWKKTGVRKVFKTEYGVAYTYEITYIKWRSDGLSRQLGPNGELLQEWNLKDWIKVGERKYFDGGYPRIVTYNDEWEEIAIREME